MQASPDNGRRRPDRSKTPGGEAAKKGASAPFAVPGGTKPAEAPEQTTAQAPPPAETPTPAPEPETDVKEARAPEAVARPSEPADPPKQEEASNPAEEPALIVVGLTERGIPQGSWFNAADAETAIRSAHMMKLRPYRVTTTAQRDLLPQLRQGRPSLSIDCSHR
jgi:outer membrane biosynthesis protein TonB